MSELPRALHKNLHVSMLAHSKERLASVRLRFCIGPARKNIHLILTAGVS